MEPTYLHQHVLHSPLPLTDQQFEKQPIPNAEIDEWLKANRADSFRSDVFLPGYLHMSDVASDQALCMVVATVNEVLARIHQNRSVV